MARLQRVHYVAISRARHRSTIVLPPTPKSIFAPYLEVCAEDQGNTWSSSRSCDFGEGFGAPRNATKSYIDSGAKGLARITSGGGGGLVGEAGLEPTISCSQSTCVTNYATPRRIHAQVPQDNGLSARW